MHATVNAAPKPSLDKTSNQNGNYKGSNYNNNYKSNTASVSAITIWEQPNNAPFKIFTSSHDGYWRLWNTAGGNFTQEFESFMNGKINQCFVSNNFLFCGFEATCSAIPNLPVGHTHVWNLQNPQQAPLELQVQPATNPPTPNACTLPYAHNQAVTAVHMAGSDPSSVQIATGSHDGSIHLWAYREPAFTLAQRMLGHIGEVTGLVLLPAQNVLWSCGTDCCIRIWNTTTGNCQHCITPTTAASGAPPHPAGAPQQPPANAIGHQSAVSSLLSFDMPGGAGTFIISGSLDGTVKAWNAATGDCVASETHNEGVVSMALGKDVTGHQVLLLGMASGTIQCRNLVQTPKMPAFQLLFALERYHDGPVKSVAAGPSATFYTGGADGKMNVFSFVGDLGL